MVHPFLASNPHLWYAATLDQTDGSDVTLWEPVLNGSDFAPSASPYATYDENGMNGDPAVAVAGSETIVNLTSDAFTSIDSYTVAIQFSSSEITAETALFILYNASDTIVWLYEAITYTLFVYDYQNYSTKFPTSYTEWPQDGTPFTVVLQWDQASQYLNFYLNGTLMNSLLLDDTDRSISKIKIGGSATWNAENAFTVDNITIVPDGTLDSTEIGTLSDYIETVDTDHLGGGVTRYLTIDGATIGSRIGVYKVPHASRGQIDMGGVTALSGGEYFDFYLHDGYDGTGDGYGEIQYRGWFNLDNGSSAPSADGTTLVEIDISTGDSTSDWADAIAAAIDALEYATATSSGTICYWEGTVNESVTQPIDVDTGADISQTRSGGTDTTQISDITTTSSTEGIQYLVAAPFAGSIGIAKSNEITSWGIYTFSIDGLVLQADVLVQTDRAYDGYSDWIFGNEWYFNTITRELTLSEENSIDSLYAAWKTWMLYDDNGLQPKPPIIPMAFEDFLFNESDFDNATSLANVRDNGFTVLDADGYTLARYIGLKSGGSINSNVTCYYVLGFEGTPVYAVTFGTVNQAIKINTVYECCAALFARKWGYTFGCHSTFDDGVMSLDATGYQLALPTISIDTKNTSPIAIAAAYSDDIDISVGDSTHQTLSWVGEIDGYGYTTEQIYEYCKYLTYESQTIEQIDGVNGNIFRGLGQVYLPYTGASGFTEGLIVTGGTSGAKAKIVADHGDALTLRMTETDHSLEFESGETITDTSTGTGTSGTADTYDFSNNAPICWFEGDTLVFSRGWYVSNLRGSIQLTSAEGTAYSYTFADISFNALNTESEVRIFENPHPQIWTMDFNGVLATDQDGTYITFQIKEESTTSDHYIWFNLDGGSSDPGATGTGHVVAILSSDSYSSLATKTYNVLNAISGLSITKSSTEITIENELDGELDYPGDNGVSASVSVTQIGGSSSAEIDGIETSTGSSWLSGCSVTYPRSILIVIMHKYYQMVRYETIITTSGLTVEAGVLQIEDRQYENP